MSEQYRRSVIEALAAALIDTVAMSGKTSNTERIAAIGLMIRDVVPNRQDRMKLYEWSDGATRPAKRK